MFDEIGLRVTQSDTYKLVYKLKEELIDGNIIFSSKFHLEVQNDFKILLIKYWLPKSPTGARFIVESSKMQHKGFVKGSYKSF